MLEFDFDGHLKPYRAISVPSDQLEKLAEEHFLMNKHRRALFMHYIFLSKELDNILTFPSFQYLDGSFVTHKSEPKDLDLVIFIDHRDFEANEKELKSLLERNKNLNLDCYFERLYPEEHKFFMRYKTDLLYWESLFSKTRAKKNKGFLKIEYYGSGGK